MTPKHRQSQLTQLKSVVLVVDPDRQTARGVGDVLERAGFLPLYASTAAEALKIARKTTPRAVVLNAVLPDMAGAKLIRMLRPLPSMRLASMLVLSVPSLDGLELECLKSGADDFLIWGVNDLSAIPFRLTRAFQPIKSDDKTVEKGIVRVDLQSREVFIRGRRLQILRPRELDLLVYLMRKSPTVVTWADVQRDVWSTPEHALHHGHETRTIAVHCERLRHKLGIASGLIVVRRGVGLLFKSVKEL